MKKLAFDTETSGIDASKHCVLTAYFAVLNDNDDIVDELDLKVIPDSGEFQWEQGALDVNGINLDEHKESAMSYSEARKLILDFFKRNSDKKRSLQPCGHNIDFDIRFITAGLVSLDDWNKYVHYRTIDTMQISSFMKDVDILPEKVGSLESLVEHFGLAKRNAHNAKEDVLMWLDVYKAYKGMFKEMKRGALSGASESLEILLVE